MMLMMMNSNGRVHQPLELVGDRLRWQRINSEATFIVNYCY